MPGQNLIGVMHRKEILALLAGLALTWSPGGLCASNPQRPAVSAFVGQHHTASEADVLGYVLRAEGVWGSLSHWVVGASLPSEPTATVLWLSKVVGHEPYKEELEIRAAAYLGTFAEPTLIDSTSCYLRGKDARPVVAVFSGALHERDYKPLQAWIVDIKNERLEPIQTSKLQCQDRKW